MYNRMQKIYFQVSVCKIVCMKCIIRYMHVCRVICWKYIASYVRGKLYAGNIV